MNRPHRDEWRRNLDTAGPVRHEMQDHSRVIAFPLQELREVEREHEIERCPRMDTGPAEEDFVLGDCGYADAKTIYPAGGRMDPDQRFGGFGAELCRPGEVLLRAAQCCSQLCPVNRGRRFLIRLRATTALWFVHGSPPTIDKQDGRKTGWDARALRLDRLRSICSTLPLRELF